MIESPTSAFAFPVQRRQKLVESIWPLCSATDFCVRFPGNSITSLILTRANMAFHASCRPAGTDGQRLFVLHLRRPTDSAPVMVADRRGALVYANSDAANLLGFTQRQLAKQSLTALIPPPHGERHTGWLRDGPPARVAPASCRAGVTVSMLGHKGMAVPATLTITTIDGDDSEVLYVMQVTTGPQAGFHVAVLHVVVNVTVALFPYRLQGVAYECFCSASLPHRSLAPARRLSRTIAACCWQSTRLAQ